MCTSDSIQMPREFFRTSDSVQLCPHFLGTLLPSLQILFDGIPLDKMSVRSRRSTSRASASAAPHRAAS